MPPRVSSKTREVFIVTHGQKHSGPNPGMTPQGFEEIRSLRDLVPPNPSAIVVGVGRRHSDTLAALACRGQARHSSVCGDADSLEMVNGQPMVILADGTPVPLAQHTSIADTRDAAKQLVIWLGGDSVICAGRPFVKALGVTDAKSAAVYQLIVKGRKILSIKEFLADGAFRTVLLAANFPNR